MANDKGVAAESAQVNPSPPKVTCLNEQHRLAGAQLVDFAGWQMPVHYGSINEEYRHVRQRAGLFDVSHMGQVDVEGRDSLAFLQYLLPADIASLDLGSMLYAPMCNHGGGCIDDLLVYRLEASRYMLVVNAGRAQVDWAWIEAAAAPYAQLALQWVQTERAMLALQGPAAAAVLEAWGAKQLDQLRYYACRLEASEFGEVLLSRSGYTGEDGFELICAAAAAPGLWQDLVALGAAPCGLGARDVLRTEMGYCLYGHELDEDISPLEAGLGWTLALDKTEDFIGRQALATKKAQGGYRRLTGMVLTEKGIPRPGHIVRDGDGQQVGQVSSGTYSPGLDQGIALAFLQKGARRPGQRLNLEMRGRSKAAAVARLPLVPSKAKKTKR